MELKATIVFQKIWNAINAVDEEGNRKYRYIKLVGSSRSSKTISTIDAYDLYCRSNKAKRCTVWRNTKTDCKKTVLNDALRHFKATNRYLRGHTFNKTESIFQYTTDSTFEIHGTEDENAVHGLTQAAAWLNEPYDIPQEVFNQIDQRTTDFLIIDMNPKMGHWSDNLDKDPRCIVIHSTFLDNPFCPVESKNKILSYQPVKWTRIVKEGLLLTDAEKTEKEAIRLNIGEKKAIEYDVLLNPLNISPGRIKELVRCRENEFKKSANEFNWCVYGLGLKAERPNRILRGEEIPDDVFFKLQVPIYTGNDWGTVHAWGILDIKYYDGGLYLHERNYDSENVVRENLTSTELAQINSSENGIVTWMYRKLGIPYDRIIVCDNNRPLKIAALREAGWEYAVAATKLPNSIIDGLDLLNNLRIYYTSSSKNVKYEIENYSRKLDSNGVVLEEPEGKDNHTIDPARYVALFLQAEGIINIV